MLICGFLIRFFENYNKTERAATFLVLMGLNKEVSTEQLYIESYMVIKKTDRIS